MHKTILIFIDFFSSAERRRRGRGRVGPGLPRSWPPPGPRSPRAPRCRWGTQSAGSGIAEPCRAVRGRALPCRAEPSRSPRRAPGGADPRCRRCPGAAEPRLLRGRGRASAPRSGAVDGRDPASRVGVPGALRPAERGRRRGLPGLGSRSPVGSPREPLVPVEGLQPRAAGTQCLARDKSDSFDF